MIATSFIILGELTLSAGKNAEGEEVSGTITVPEVAHDTEEDEYVVRSLRSLSRCLFNCRALC